jgi:hypothetical protein
VIVAGPSPLHRVAGLDGRCSWVEVGPALTNDDVNGRGGGKNGQEDERKDEPRKMHRGSVDSEELAADASRDCGALNRLLTCSIYGNALRDPILNASGNRCVV